jgi:hypothetical protein
MVRFAFTENGSASANARAVITFQETSQPLARLPFSTRGNSTRVLVTANRGRDFHPPFRIACGMGTTRRCSLYLNGGQARLPEGKT